MKESIGNQRVRRSNAFRLAAIDRGRGHVILRRIKLSFVLDGFLHALVFVHAKSLDPSHTEYSLVWNDEEDLSVATGSRSFLNCGVRCGLPRRNFLSRGRRKRDADVFMNRLPLIVIFWMRLAVGTGNRLC